MEGLFDSSDDASDPSDDGKEQSQFLVLNADVLRQIVMSLKPADVYSLSLTCKQFEENGKLMLGTLMKAQLDRVMLDQTARYTLAGTGHSRLRICFREMLNPEHMITMATGVHR